MFNINCGSVSLNMNNALSGGTNFSGVETPKVIMDEIDEELKQHIKEFDDYKDKVRESLVS